MFLLFILQRSRQVEMESALDVLSRAASLVENEHSKLFEQIIQKQHFIQIKTNKSDRTRVIVWSEKPQSLVWESGTLSHTLCNAVNKVL